MHNGSMTTGCVTKRFEVLDTNDMVGNDGAVGGGLGKSRYMGQGSDATTNVQYSATPEFANPRQRQGGLCGSDGGLGLSELCKKAAKSDLKDALVESVAHLEEGQAGGSLCKQIGVLWVLLEAFEGLQW